MKTIDLRPKDRSTTPALIFVRTLVALLMLNGLVEWRTNMGATHIYPTPALRDMWPIYTLATAQLQSTPQPIYVVRVVERVVIATPIAAPAVEPIAPVVAPVVVFRAAPTHELPSMAPQQLVILDRNQWAAQAATAAAQRRALEQR
jgi:hypothetical protein